jgi:hypothetical protein
MSTIGRSEKTSQLFLEFRYGDPAAPTYARFTDWTEDTILGSQSYDSTPDMEVRAPEISGILNDKTLQVALPLKVNGFTDRLSNGTPHSPIYVTLRELLRSLDGGSSEQQVVLFKGRVSRVIRNPNGRTNSVGIEAKSLKSQMDVPMGLPANHQCVWTFGGRGCFVTVPTENGTLATITGKTVTITGLAGHADRYWHRGFVERQGLRLLIREWVNGTSFELAKEPPADWATQTVKVYAGCDKTIETCRARWSNEINFGGFGYAIPAYHPVFESP